MRSAMRSQVFVCIFVSIVVLVTSLNSGYGLRHRHEGGEAAHSHTAVSNSSSRTHGHTHSHSHLHGHSHSHSHTHSDSHADDEAEDAGAHIHVTILGFEFTLPDFLGGEPAPLVDNAPESQNEVAHQGEVVRLPSPFSLAQLIEVALRWTAIECSRVKLDGTNHPFGRNVVASEIRQGHDPSAPLLPPPQVL